MQGISVTGSNLFASELEQKFLDSFTLTEKTPYRLQNMLASIVCMTKYITVKIAAVCVLCRQKNQREIFGGHLLHLIIQLGKKSLAMTVNNAWTIFAFTVCKWTNILRNLMPKVWILDSEESEHFQTVSDNLKLNFQKYTKHSLSKIGALVRRSIEVTVQID